MAFESKAMAQNYGPSSMAFLVNASQRFLPFVELSLTAAQIQELIQFMQSRQRSRVFLLHQSSVIGV
jgi:hypothetical protein